MLRQNKCQKGELMVRKFKVGVLTILAVMMFSVPVLAGSYFEFYLTEIEEDGDSIYYSGNVTKSNDDNAAYVSYSKSTYGSDLRYCVIGQNGDYSEYTETAYANALSGTYPMYYNRDYYCGNNYRLKASLYSSVTSAQGEWEP